MSIGERIKTRRLELGMSQEELAKKIGYKSRSSINKIEIGSLQLRQKKIKEIAIALETTPSYIMGWEEETSDLDKEKRQLTESELSESKSKLIELVKNLSEEDCKAVLRLLDRK